MGIARSQFQSILNGIFKAGNTIHLFETVPRESDEGGGVRITGGSYVGYTIQSGDFSVGEGEVTSTRNMMLYLCEDSGGNGTARGFGVYSGNTMLYFGEFTTPMPIGYNTVPTIKKYSASKGEGVHITLTSTNVSATAE